MVTKSITIEGTEYIKYLNGYSHAAHSFYGNSNDTKPSYGVMNGETFYEMDTKKVYIFDEENKKWCDV